MAERVGFEPTCRLPDKTLSRRPRYDHFGTSPDRVLQACVLKDARTGNYNSRSKRAASWPTMRPSRETTSRVLGADRAARRERYARGGGPWTRGGAAGGTEPKTFIAAAIMPDTSDSVAGMISVLLDFASFPNWSTYCSATRS